MIKNIFKQVGSWKLKTVNSDIGLPVSALWRSNSQTGQSLIELLITIGLLAIILPALLTGFVAARSGRAQQEQRQLALGYVKEGEEAVRIYREADWNNFALKSSVSSPGTNYYPVSTGTTWSLTTGIEQGGIGGSTLQTDFSRSITIVDVWRDSSGNIIGDTHPAGSYDDPSTKKVTTTVSWNNPIPNSSVSLTEYLTRYGNAAYSDNGTLPPPAGGGGNWCNPTAGIIGTPFTLGAIPITLVANSTSSQDFAYTSTGNNRSSGSPLFELNISHDTTPQVTNPYSSPDNAKAYGIFSDGTYVYFNENNAGHTVEIAKVSDLSDVGFFDNGKYVSGSITTSSTAVLGTGGTPGATGYTAVGNMLYSFDLSTIPTKDSKGNMTTQKALSSISLSGNGLKIIISGGYAYVVTDDTTNQLQKIQLLSSGQFGTKTNIPLGNGQAGVDLSIDETGKYAYIVTNYSPGNFDVYAIDLSDPTNPLNRYGYSTHMKNPPDLITGDMNPRGVAAVTDDKVIVVGCNADNGNDKCLVHSTGNIYQVFDFSNGPATGSRCGGMTPQLTDNSTTPPTVTNLSSINAIAGVDQRAYTGNVFSYIVDGVNSTSQFQIIKGGAGVSGGSGTGIYESAPFDPGNTVAYNYFYGSNPKLTYKIAIKPTNCSSAIFIDNDFVLMPNGPIPFSTVGYTNPGECMKYRAINTGNTTESFSVTINYSL